MLNNRPTRTVLVLLGLLAFSSPLQAKKNKKAAEVPSDLPAGESREPARIGPGITEEPPLITDIVPGDKPAVFVPPATEEPPVKLMDSPTAESALDTPAERKASSEETSSDDGKTDEERQAEARLNEMKADQAAREEKEKQTEAEYEGKATAQAEEEAKAAALAEMKAEADAKAKAQAAEAAEAAEAAKAEAAPERKTAEADSTSELRATRAYTWASPLRFGLDLQFAPVRYPSLALDDQGTVTAKYGNGARVNFEWLFFQDAGKVAVGAGLHFSNIPNTINANGENIAVNVIGAEVGFTYRADFVAHQILVPFGHIAMDFDYVVQSRADGGGTSSQGGYRGVILGGGMELCLFIFERRTARLLDRKFGINETYLVFEYLRSDSAKPGVGPNLSHDEFRIGLRFEI